jgi:hypothetical protein
MSTTMKVMYSVRSFLGAKGDRQCYYSNMLDSFATEAIEGLRRFLEMLLIITHFLEGG